MSAAKKRNNPDDYEHGIIDADMIRIGHLTVIDYLVSDTVSTHNDTASDSHVPNPNLPVIDLKKEQPPVSLPLMRDTFKLTNVTAKQSDTRDIYGENCIAYAFKDGKLYLTFKMNTETGPNILFRKKMMHRVRIEHFGLCDDYGLQSDPLVMDYHIAFAYIETNSSRDDYHSEMTVTLVYKVTEW